MNRTRIGTAKTRRRAFTTVSLLLVALVSAACGTAGDVAQTSDLPNGVTFADPEGSYQMVVSNTWTASPGSVVAGIETWLVGEPVDGFASNVNALTQVVPASTTLEDYLELSIESAPNFIDDFRLIRQEIVDGSEGQPLAIMEYEGAPQGETLRFLAVFGMGDGLAVVATLTTRPQDAERQTEEIEPYLLTLIPTP